jgi:signal transduction histidine kinase
MVYMQRLLSSKTGAKFTRRRYLQDILWALGGVVLVTSVGVAMIEIFSPQHPIILYIFQYPFRTIFVPYLIIVLILASFRGLFPALLASILSLLTFDFFFTPPLYTLNNYNDPNSLFASGMFLFAAIVVSCVTSSQRRRSDQASRREQELAALRERHRLARELHDSVSQALYGVSLGAHTAREVLPNEPEQAMASLDYVIALAEAGLAEMRALIFELRPESLETEGLVAALSKQVAVLQTRYKLTVKTDFCEEPELPFEQKEALYRIGHEALHNVVKHAQATRVKVRLWQEGDEISLEVHDDGRGFDPRGSFPGHLGLSSMRERASKISGTFEIESAPGAGTRLFVRLARPKPPKSSAKGALQT